MDLTEDTLAARMALASIGRPGFGAGAQWLGRSTERSGWPIAKKTDYMQPKTIGSNWIRDGRGNVQVMHGSRNVADILDPGFNRTGGYVYATPDPDVSNRILHSMSPGADKVPQFMNGEWKMVHPLLTNKMPDSGSGVLRGWVPEKQLLEGLGVSNLREQEILMEPNQANKVFGVGEEPNLRTRMLNAVTPSVMPSQWVGPLNIDETYALRKDDYAFNKILNKSVADKILLNVAKAGGVVGRALPVAGQTLGAIDVTNRIDEGDYLGAGLSGIGMIPAVGVPALAALGAYDAYEIVNNPSTGPEPMSVPSAFTTPQYGDQAYRSFDPVMPDPIPTE